MNTNPYETLNVKSDATQEEIKNAYRNLAKKLHPDLNPGNKTGEKKFKEVNAAYELIGTPEAKAKYDRSETEAQAEAKAKAERNYYYQTQGDSAGNAGRYSHSFQGTDEDLFSSLFGNQRQRPPRDAHYTLQVDFKDSILGAEKEFSLPNGPRLKVKIPPGIVTGNKLKFAGLATSVSTGTIPGGSRSASNGDVYIEVNINPSPVFARNGNDIEIEIPISATESLLGVELKVPTLDGSVLLTVPPFVSSGQKFRIAGKGVPGKGDQLVKIKIVNPSIKTQSKGKEITGKDFMDQEFKNAILEWNRRQPFHPREDKI